MDEEFTCSVCGKTKPIQREGGTGYAVRNDDEKVCYDCCATEDIKWMKEHDKISLYLTNRFLNTKTGKYEPRTIENERNLHSYFVTNWPGTLNIKCSFAKEGKHNIARKRIDVWFGNLEIGCWHGVQYGDFTELVHCKKMKRTHFFGCIEVMEEEHA